VELVWTFGRAALLVACVLLLASGSAGGSRAGGCVAIVVTHAVVAYAHDRSIQAAVDQARPCDWVLVAPGRYPGPVTITTREVHLRGLNRDGVVIDGGGHAGNGITVRADGVSVENLTVRNFDRRSPNDDDTGNQVRWWDVAGWQGRYLTVYDTGLRGGYGIWAGGSSEGLLDHVYASGFSDSGLYVGGCRDCRTLLEDSVAERSLIGLAATNASGHLIVEDSLFRLNAVGLSLNSSLSDPPPPQLGTCNAGANRSTAPTLATTRLARCTIVRADRFIDNNTLDVPSETSSVRPGAGIGIDLLGAYGDLIEDNEISGNRNIGVLGLELPERGAARFALAGNRISGNRISGSRLAIALAGSDRSVNNCLEHDSGSSTLPTDLAAYACTRATTPSLPALSTSQILALIARLSKQFVTHARAGQPAPPSQPTMPHPCRGVPASPLCKR
jgi:hypothetical protein